MFIGDGMGNPQVTATQYYLGSIENPDSKFPVPADLSFTKFPYLGLVTTYDSSSFCPDSASTATSMASGKKTKMGIIRKLLSREGGMTGGDRRRGHRALRRHQL
ncbi:MAG: alkaline phosphatase [Christensenellales bacterium]